MKQPPQREQDQPARRQQHPQEPEMRQGQVQVQGQKAREQQPPRVTELRPAQGQKARELQPPRATELRQGQGQGQEARKQQHPPAPGPHQRPEEQRQEPS